MCEFRWGWISVAEAIGEGWLRPMWLPATQNIENSSAAIFEMYPFGVAAAASSPQQLIIVVIPCL
jgi:hypothetical protein